MFWTNLMAITKSKVILFALITAYFACVANGQKLLLGNKRPEGMIIPKGDDVPEYLIGTALVAQIYLGGIDAINLETGDVQEIVPSAAFGTRPLLGLWHEPGAIIAAGGGPIVGPGVNTTVYMFSDDEGSGELLLECDVDGVFLNDLTVSGETLYITDSVVNVLHALNLTAASEGECVAEKIELPEEFQASGFDFRANGIRGYQDGLLIANTFVGSLEYLDLSTGEITNMISPGTIAPDGLCFGDSDGELYIVENGSNLVSSWQLNGTETPATFVGNIVSEDYDSPSTCSVLDGTVWTVNARFASLGQLAPGEASPTFDGEFHIVGLPIDDFEGSPTAAPTNTETSAPTNSPGTSSSTMFVATASLVLAFLQCFVSSIVS